ncbi:MAG: hypothetical protein JST68_04130 [Bacteroidetes bacterium]|nr:hypothetical protein [Bacteroidota bacterium]
MSSITLSITSVGEAVSEVLDYISEFYGREDYDQGIEDALSSVFNEFRDDLWVLIEYPYVDKVYRDSYYTYFASKNNAYARDCIRVCVFSGEIALEQFRTLEGEEELRRDFLGYVVIRPTFSHPVGRTLLDKRAFKENNFVICNYQGNVAVNGVKLNVSGFPYSSQDTESISCAETTIWSIMEYFGNRYPEYKPTYPSNIIGVLSRFSKQRLLPSNGLTVDQISYALKEFGFGTSVYAREEAYGDEIENIIAYYIESGIPVIVTFENESSAHAIVIIGYETGGAIDFDSVSTSEISYGEEKVSYFDYTDVPKRYVVNDDNLAPYRTIDLGDPVEYYEEDWGFGGSTISSVIVPLYKKIYLEVTKARELALAILADADFGYRYDEGFVFRFFLTSSRSFKEHISRSELGGAHKDCIILSRMPKFVWCAEFYEKGDFHAAVGAEYGGMGAGKASGLVIIDATEANEVSNDSLIFAGYPDRVLVKNEGKFVTLSEPLGFYKGFKSNLS